MPVAGERMNVQISREIRWLEKDRQGPRLGGLDLAAVFPELGRDEGKSQPPVHRLLSSSRDSRPSAKHTVLVYLESPGPGDLP